MDAVIGILVHEFVELGVIPVAFKSLTAGLILAPVTDLIFAAEANSVNDELLIMLDMFENYTNPKLNDYLDDMCKDLEKNKKIYRLFHVDIDDLLRECECRDE